MNSAIYDLPIKNNAMRWTATAWLTLGLASLVAAGFYSILLVLARTPIVQEVIPLVDFSRRSGGACVCCVFTPSPVR